MEDIGILTEVTDLREWWPDEAQDFTPWLADERNLAILSDTIGVDIRFKEMESGVGDFRADILGVEADTGRTVIIENQLEETDHDHLGKLLTYAAGKSAAVMVWIVRRAREEHQAAIEWLNDHTDNDIGFFLCEVKLYTIDNSRPAVKFEVLQRPNSWSRRYKTANTDQQFRFDYWRSFKDYAFKSTDFSKEFRPRQPQDHGLDLAIGSGSCKLVLAVTTQKRQTISVCLYIWDNKDLFDRLQNDAEKLKQEIGLSLEWRSNPDKKASRIITERPAAFADKTLWAEQFEWLMNTALKFKQVFRKQI